MIYIDDDDKFECIIFKMSPGLNGLNELRDLPGKFYWHLQKVILLNL